MDLRINQKSHVPVHVQLEEQIKHLILSGGVGVGERLPSIRELAGFLRVNRNTVSRVISDLEREGFVETRRGSGVYVLEPPVGGAERYREEVIERVVELASARGVPLDEIAGALMARFESQGAEKVKILFVECTQAELDQFADELEEQLPVEVERVLMEDLSDRLSRDGELPWAIATTTFFHVHEVEEMMEPFGVETLALLANANIESLQKLIALPEGTVVGVVGASETCMVNLARSLAGAGLDHLDLKGEVYIDETEEVRKLFTEVEAIACSSITAGKLEKIGVPENVQIIEEDRTLDKGGIEMLGRMLREMSAG